jgi:hypothetical protein
VKIITYTSVKATDGRLEGVSPDVHARRLWSSNNSQSLHSGYYARFAQENDSRLRLNEGNDIIFYKRGVGFTRHDITQFYGM